LDASGIRFILVIWIDGHPHAADLGLERGTGGRNRGLGHVARVLPEYSEAEVERKGKNVAEVFCDHAEKFYRVSGAGP
jgi:hypothetical protein